MPGTRGQAGRNGSNHHAKRGNNRAGRRVHAPLSPAHDRFGLIRIHGPQKGVVPHFSPLDWNAEECVIFITESRASPAFSHPRMVQGGWTRKPNRTVRSSARVFGNLLEICSCAVQHGDEYANRSELFSDGAKKYSEEMVLPLLKKAANQVN